ncbi:DUF4836 family protein [Chitinophaga qingshengii]|uniref:DUF4836 family protein n=1 Tax=Chitinophaga qingshengii TaxID=1569794 RepID=A0ABR7TP18_9BACT|nr:DUF4836 family protein [Chitinophaga qingshengii]MBC9931743.1 DUF4836 family protein [Chitinophaga qingshengii]
MKRTISKVLLTAVTAAVVLSACSKVPEVSKHIPKSAGVVLDLNAKEITQKLATNGLTMDKLFSAVQTKDSSEMMKSWKDAQNAGIDLKGHFFVSFVSDSSSYVTATASLTDADKFEAFLKKNEKNFTLKSGSDFKYILEGESKGIVAWNKSTVIFVSDFDPNNLRNGGFPSSNSTEAYPEEQVDSAATAVDSAVATPVALVTADEEAATQHMVRTVDRLFHLKKDETAGSLEPFAKMLKENADVSIFVNPNALYGSSMFAMVPANFKKLMEGTYYTATSNFEKGRIVANGTYYMGKEIARIYNKYGKKEIDLDMLKKYPSQNVTGFISYAFDFHMVGEIVKSTGMDGVVNMFLAKSGLSMDDVLNAFEGQFTYVASDLAIQKKESKYFPGEFSEEPTAKWIFNMKVGNKEAFNKVMTSPMMKEMFTKEGDRYVYANPAMAAAGMPAVSITEKFITVGSDSTLLQDYLAGKGSIKLPEGIESKVKGSMMGGYIDMEKALGVIPEDKMNSEEEKGILAKLKNLMKDATMVTKNSSGDVSQSEIILNFKNKDENSLVQLINFGKDAAQAMEAKKAREKSMEDSLFSSSVDSAAVPATSAH